MVLGALVPEGYYKGWSEGCRPKDFGAFAGVKEYGEPPRDNL